MVAADPPSGVGDVHRYWSGNAFGGLILSFNVRVWFEAGTRDAVLPGRETHHQSTVPLHRVCRALDGLGTSHLKADVMLPWKGWPVKRIL